MGVREKMSKDVIMVRKLRKGWICLKLVGWNKYEGKGGINGWIEVINDMFKEGIMEREREDELMGLKRICIKLGWIHG